MSPRRRILPIFVPHAGCPNDCVFCNQRRISGSLFPATADTVCSAVEALPAGGGYELAFYGGSFTAIPGEQQEELLSAAREAMERGKIESVRVSTRPDAIDAAVLRRLKQYGVETVELGAQSMCDEVLRLSGRGHTREDTVRAAGQIKAAGLRLVLQMMTGLPGSNEERDTDTASALIELAPDAVRIYPTVVIRDTALEELWRAGAYREHTVEAAVCLCAKLLPLFEAAGIPVIRLGLNPTEELSGGAAVAGAYHPAFGELVRSRILREKAEALLVDILPKSRVTLLVKSRDISAMTGQHRENLAYLRERFALEDIRVKPWEDADGVEVRVGANSL